jgi:hypothetical protein
MENSDQQAPHTEQQSPEQEIAEQQRREALRKIAKFCGYAAPVMLGMLDPTAAAAY